MKAFWAAWDRAWFRPFDPVSVSVFRICFGLLLLAFLTDHATNWERNYASDGIRSLDATDPTRAHESRLSVFFWTEGKVPVRVFWWAGILGAACFTVGLGTRPATVLLFVLITSMSHANKYLISGEDIVFRMLLFLGCFAPLGRALSVDALLRRRLLPNAAAQVEPSIWAVRLMQVNIALAYALSVPRKLDSDAAWLDGTAIYWTMLNSTWSRGPWPELFQGTRGMVLSAVATYWTVISEAAFPLLVWFRPLRLYVLAAVAALHLGIALFMQNLVFFSLAMVCSFWLFVPPETTRRLGGGMARLFGRAWRGRREGAYRGSNRALDAAVCDPYTASDVT
jgi:hypothetical protein